MIGLIAAVFTASTGCGGGAHQQAATSAAVQTPDPALAQDEVVGLVRPSVVKVSAEANSCNKLLKGTGFVVGPRRVLTNAHVVAGGVTVKVQTGDKDVDAHVVSFDPDADIAVLDVPDLSAPPLTLASYEAKSGAEALVLGFPGAGDFTAMPARIREVNNLNGPNIYHAADITRSVYVFTIAGGRDVHGASGSPLVDMRGRVLGVVFGNEVDDEATGFALTSEKVAPLIPPQDSPARADTGACVT